MTDAEIIAELGELRKIKARAQEMARTSNDDSLTPQQARNAGVARYILTGQKH